MALRLRSGHTRLLIATTNRDKLGEIRRVLKAIPVELIGLADLPSVAEPEETGQTFEDNARLKALYYDRYLGKGARGAAREPVLTVAEDSGLVVDALAGEPGVTSARFLNPGATYPERFSEIFRRLAEQPGHARGARFVCALAVAREGALVFETTGTVEGEISDSPRGSAGFGYDPIFYYPAYGCTLAEVTEQAKLAVAHRGRAFRNLTAWLENAMIHGHVRV